MHIGLEPITSTHSMSHSNRMSQHHCILLKRLQRILHFGETNLMDISELFVMFAQYLKTMNYAGL